VETSLNLAIVRTNDDNTIDVSFLLRSLVESAKDDIASSVESIFRLAGAEVELSGAYPGWRPNADSEVLKTASLVYQRLFDKEPSVRAIHAGLECGIMGGIYPKWEMISFGPTIRHPHSPDENVDIASVERFWTFLTELIRVVK
jgi:dipeptidase D